MAEVQNHILGTDVRNLDYTISLTEAAESGDISPDEYARRRASEYIIIPLLQALWRRLFQSDMPSSVLVKSKSD
jgi:hypothetical protein